MKFVRGVLVLALLAWSSISTAVGAAIDKPVALTGWNVDDIAGATESYPYSNNNVNGWNFYQPGFPGSIQGLPVDGTRTLVTASGTPFQLAPYAGNNTSFVNPGSPQTLTLASPASFASLQFLDIDGNGFPTDWNVTLNFSDGSHATIGNYADKDWTNGSTNGSVAFTNYGLVAQGNPGNFYNGFLAAYEHDYTLSPTDEVKLLDSITLNNTDNGTLMFLAMSGVTVPEPSSLIALCGLGMMGMFLVARRTRSAWSSSYPAF